jgi:hypothetical protein
MKKLVLILPIIIALGLVAVPAGAARVASQPQILTLARTAVTNAAHAKSPHFVTETDISKLSPPDGNTVVSVVVPLGGYSNARIAGFVTLKTPVPECILFPARTGAGPSIATCPTGAKPLASWAARIDAAGVVARIDARAYTLSSSPSLAVLQGAAKTKGVVPTGYRVTVSTGTNITPSIKFEVTKGSAAAISVCVSAPTPPAAIPAYIAPYGLAPC